jgi:hypothetical protein
MREDVTGGRWQDERLLRHGGQGAGEASAIGGDQASAFVGREIDAVEDVAGGVGGGAAGDV